MDELHPTEAHRRLEVLLVNASAEMVRGVRMSTTCAVHAHDEWVPTNAHHVWPLGMGGPDKAANKVTLCMNGHGAVHAYMDHLIRYGPDADDPRNPNGGVPWSIAMHFGTKVRWLAFSGWDQAGRPRSGVVADPD